MKSQDWYGSIYYKNRTGSEHNFIRCFRDGGAELDGTFINSSFWVPKSKGSHGSNDPESYYQTPWNRVLLEKLTVSQLVKKFPAFYRLDRFITVSTTDSHRTQSWDGWIQSLHKNRPYFFKELFKIIPPPTSRPPKWPLPFTFTNLNITRTSHRPIW
jgi:hypothetical protein